jgi:hypothetical protein
MSLLVKTKCQVNFKDFKRFGAFKGLVEQKNVVFNSFVCKWSFFGTRGPKKPNLHMYSLNNSILLYELHKTVYCRTRGFGARRTQ